MEAEAKSTLWPLVNWFLWPFHPPVLFCRSRMILNGWWQAGQRLGVTSGEISEKVKVIFTYSYHFREEVRSDDFFWNRMAFMYCLKQVIHLLISNWTGFSWRMIAMFLTITHPSTFSFKKLTQCSGRWLCRPYWWVCWSTIQVCRPQNSYYWIHFQECRWWCGRSNCLSLERGLPLRVGEQVSGSWSWQGNEVQLLGLMMEQLFTP